MFANSNGSNDGSVLKRGVMDEALNLLGLTPRREDMVTKREGDQEGK